MAAGLPVVSTDVGDVRGMVADENAAFIVPRDPEAMAAAMRALLADPALCHSIGTANRALAEHRYARETMIAAHLALIESLRARRGSAISAQQ
jgi:glycosyltransferase involved in cell wall biosynthesis